MTETPNPDDAWRLALRRRLEAGETISGRPKPLWARPPMQPVELSAAPEAMRARMRQPKGALQGLLGPRLSATSLIDADRHDEADLPALGLVAAYEVRPLVGAEFTVEAVTAVPAAVRSLLAQLLPGIDWWVPEHWEGPFLKYGILHNTLPAPPNEATGEAMALELYGHADSAQGPDSDAWAQSRLRWMEAGGRDADEPQGVTFPTRVCITVATYANLTYPGYGVPLYM